MKQSWYFKVHLYFSVYWNTIVHIVHQELEHSRLVLWLLLFINILNISSMHIIVKDIECLEYMATKEIVIWQAVVLHCVGL